MITAKKGNVTRNFSDRQWKLLPAGKFGWEPVNTSVKVTAKQPIVPSEIVQKKVNAGVVTAKENKVPDELTGNEPAEKPKTKSNVKRPKE